MKETTNNSTFKAIVTTTIALLAVILIPTGCADSLFNPGNRSNHSGNSQPPASGTNLGLVKVTISGIGTQQMSASASAYTANTLFDFTRPSNIPNKALSLDGKGDYVGSIGAFGIPFIGNPERTLTLEAWVYPASEKGSAETFLSFSIGNGIDRILLSYDPDSGHFTYKDPNGKVKSEHAFAPNNWYHVAVVINKSDSGTLYVNGKEEADFTTNLTQNLGKFTVGQESYNSTASGFFNGRIDEVRIWLTARAKSEIKANMKKPISGGADHLIIYYKFNRLTNNKVIDVAEASGNFNGTLIGDAELIEKGAPITIGNGNGTIQMKPLNHGSFIVGERGDGGMRYVWATFKVRNAEAGGTFYNTPRQNLTFMAADNANTVGHTAILEMKLFNGEEITGNTAGQIASNIIPTGRVTARGGELVMVKAGVLQVYTEQEAEAINQETEAGVDVFPYGFVTRSPDITPSSRKLPALPAQGRYAGIVTFAFKIPLQPQPKQDPFKITMLFLPADDDVTRITQSLKNSTAVVARALNINAKSMILLPGSSLDLEGWADVRRVCKTRVAGTKQNPTSLLIPNPPVLQSVTPDPYTAGGNDISNQIKLSASFSKPVITRNERALFAVYGSQSGRHFVDRDFQIGNDGKTVTSPQATFFPGEMIEVTIPSALGLCKPTVARYRVEATGGSGEFKQPQAGTTIQVGVDPTDIIAFNFNTTSLGLELAVINENSSDLTILTQNGSGTYSVGNTISVGSGFVAITAGDWDENGQMGFAVANPVGDKIIIRFDDGFTIRVSVLNNPVDLTAGDWDGDGDPDLAVANAGSGDVALVINRVFSFNVNRVFLEGSGLSSITSGDWDGDGDLDLAVTDEDDDEVKILENDGSGIFSVAGTYNTGNSPASVIAADLDENGSPDLAVANSLSDNVTILLNKNDGSGEFTKSADISVGNGTEPADLTAGDWDGDDDLDLAVANEGTGEVSILINNGSGTFSEPNNPVSVGPGPVSVTSANLDSDGDLDLAVTISSDDVAILINKDN